MAKHDELRVKRNCFCSPFHLPMKTITQFDISMAEITNQMQFIHETHTPHITIYRRYGLLMQPIVKWYEC